MSLFDGKFHVMSKEFIEARIRYKKNCCCALCGCEFKEGDPHKWIYANSTPHAGCGNFMICEKCDGPDALQRGIESCKQATKMAKQWGLYGPDWQGMT